MQDQEPPKIEFPCDYPIKVLGRKSDAFRGVVLDVVRRHAPGFDEAGIEVRESKKGTFTSLTIIITATGKDQLEALHEDLIASGHVQMVL
ncbi:MAG: DUF493 domain-containing protein [Pseudomonadota bacterium]